MRVWQIITILCGAAGLAGTLNMIEGKRVEADWIFTLLAFAIAGFGLHKIRQKKREQDEVDNYWD